MTIAVVTGSSGGVGQILARQLQDAGHFVIGIDHKPAPTNVVHAQYRHLKLDLSNLDELRIQIRNIEDGVGLFIHAAAIQPLAEAATGNIKEWRSAFDVNVLSAEVVASELKESLKLNPPHAVFAIGSIHDRQTSRSIAPYSVSKAALAGWVRAMAIDLAPQVSVINIAIGATLTPMLLAGLGRNGDQESALSRLEHSLLPERILDPADVARTCLQLLNCPLKHLSGSTIRLDGGSSIVLGGEIQ